jgi:hypothetical protein
MVTMLGILETAGLVSIFVLSSDYGIRPAYSLSSLALMFLVGLNLFFAVIYFK